VIVKDSQLDVSTHEGFDLVEEDSVPESVFLGPSRLEVFELSGEGLASEGTFDSRGVECLSLDRLVNSVENTRYGYDELVHAENRGQHEFKIETQKVR
jgi:hypothetical protein